MLQTQDFSSYNKPVQRDLNYSQDKINKKFLSGGRMEKAVSCEHHISETGVRCKYDSDCMKTDYLSRDLSKTKKSCFFRKLAS